MSTTVTKTLRVRIKDKHVALLRRMAKEVNTVWNYCNQANQDHWRKYHQHLTGYDLNKLTTGSSPAFQLVGDNTIQAVGQHYATKRRASGKKPTPVAQVKPQPTQLLPRMGAVQKPRRNIQRRTPPFRRVQLPRLGLLRTGYSDRCKDG